eukprot:CAMPEP_0205944458 /NCGR_PEP_ID=MMETSP1325-20131115/63304_1 /ASSEMBLY_ACC=CAM_ASM_000708 /TAXON_ID=236786 /ORGANISM="Florenciella sp., Strain RCC1007" /LENGTH=42 /DNA_ID= /DNA_START= /DNA_END= /DNA_ORIENTATION=
MSVLCRTGACRSAAPASERNVASTGGGAAAWSTQGWLANDRS